VKTVEAECPVPVHSLAPFVVLTFGLSWGIIALFILAPETMTAVFGTFSGDHPLFLLAIYSPSIAGIALVAFHGGAEGLRGYLGRLALWRCPPAWYGFILVVTPLLFIVGAALKGIPPVDWLPEGPAFSVLAAMGLMALKGAWEEPGWRGFALPLLQRRLVPFWAGLVVGAVWGVWHLPAFLLSGTDQSNWAFMPFVAGSMALSLIMVAMVNASRGSILLPALFHYQLINPLWPDAQPYDNALFIVAAVVVVWLNRQAMFSRDFAVTSVIGSED